MLEKLLKLLGDKKNNKQLYNNSVEMYSLSKAPVIFRFIKFSTS